MTREEVKELLPIIQAFAEGKTVQYLDRIDSWRDYNDPSFCGNLKYRIKPEPKYRPFKSQEECWNEMLKHEPFGWLFNKQNNSYEFIGKDVSSKLLFNNIFREYTFADGTPFGAKEE